MNPKDKIFIAGHTGLVGSSILRLLKARGFSHLIFRTHRELDLIDQVAVNTFFEKVKPDFVILAAARVGGIYANNKFPADFIYQNIMIQANIIHAAYENNVKSLLFLGSSCIYPKFADQPITENSLLTDVLESSNEPYAIAKIAGIKLCESYNRQHGTDFRSLMPTNLYGKGDNFHLRNSHVIPAIMRKIHLAKCIEINDWDAIRADLRKNSIKSINENSSKNDILKALTFFDIKTIDESSSNILRNVEVNIWGTGNALRDFLSVDDMAEASIFFMEMEKINYLQNTIPTLSHVNVGSGKEISIKEIALMIQDIIGFKGSLIFDSSRPDGTPRKLLDVSRLNDLGWKHRINLHDGLRDTYKWYSK
jgi:GDP-L-fucose synthase